jgi:CubicO group peptidase (beta-lactamase class C family)
VLDLESYAPKVADFEETVVGVGVHDRGRSEWLVLGAPADARFRIASLTKPFVAQLALMFADEKLLELDSPALEGAPTVRELLAHEGGVQPDLAEMERFGEGGDALQAAVRAVLDRRRRFQAGRAWEYANSGYWIGRECTGSESR